jgi:hypothetical protein
VTAKALRLEPKWTRFPLSEEREGTQGVTLADFFTIKRGLATGANSFFIMTRRQIRDRDLPMECFRPILPSPRYLPQDEVLADEDGHPMIERQLFLLDCRLAEHEVKAKYPALWKYLESGKPEVSERYLCRHRNPWYAQEDRPPAPLVCTYLGRQRTNGRRLFRFILNHSQATAPNVYLLLYPKPALAGELAQDPELVRRVWTMLNEIRSDTFVEEGRVYGGGLHKLEPKELANVPADQLLALGTRAGRHVVRQARLFAVEDQS